jgi:hypothetical protein
MLRRACRCRPFPLWLFLRHRRQLQVHQQQPQLQQLLSSDRSRLFLRHRRQLQVHQRQQQLRQLCFPRLQNRELPTAPMEQMRLRLRLVMARPLSSEIRALVSVASRGTVTAHLLP